MKAVKSLHVAPPVTRPRNLSLLPAGGPGLGPPGAAALTCRHEEDAGTQDDVVSSLIELAGCDAESTHEEQNHTQDREDARGPHSPWRTQFKWQRVTSGSPTPCPGQCGPGRRQRSFLR